MAYEISDRGDKLIESSREFSGSLLAAAQAKDETGIAYFFTMITIASVLAVFACRMALISAWGMAGPMGIRTVPSGSSWCGAVFTARIRSAHR